MAEWEWALDEQAEAHAATLTNTDGDEIDLAVATFRVADWTRLEKALAARADIEADAADRWTWHRADAHKTTVLASLERVADELLVEVNSAPRLVAVRSLLEAIPGVAFVRAREPDPTDDLQHGGNRGIDPSTLSPEARAAIQAQLDARIMTWLDERIPMLGNRTPREAVRTPEDRETVLRLIRSWPDPDGIPGVRIPRERLRRELGLPDARKADAGDTATS